MTTVGSLGTDAGAVVAAPPATTVAALDAAAIRRLSESMGEPGWLTDLRLEWWARVEATPAPSGLEEE